MTLFNEHILSMVNRSYGTLVFITRSRKQLRNANTFITKVIKSPYDLDICKCRMAFLLYLADSYDQKRLEKFPTYFYFTTFRVLVYSVWLVRCDNLLEVFHIKYSETLPEALKTLLYL